MSKISLNIPAPDFELPDYEGKMIRLSDYQGKSNVLLVFNRGFM
ncbi:MAG: redoxin domain-containing protein [Chloroflexota bacterium]